MLLISLHVIKPGPRDSSVSGGTSGGTRRVEGFLLPQTRLGGRNAFHQLLRSQCREGSGEWEYLAEFARRETQPPPAAAETRRLLKRRQLLTETPGGEWRLVVPLMARWLRKEG